MLAINDQQGFMPIWHLNGYETECMTGISSLQVVAEAYMKGYRGFDAERAYQALRKTAMSDLRGLNYLRDCKIIPSDAKILKAIPSDASSIRTVAQAMEMSISDGSIALMAKALGKKEDFNYFSKRAKNYQLFYDKSVGFFRGIKADGTRSELFDPIKTTKPWAADYAEGNAWQYLWLAPQDAAGLVSFLGGKDVFNKRLDSFFNLNTPEDAEKLSDITGLIGQYAHGNEPSHHIAYMYSYSGQQWKTAEKVRYILKEFYHDDPDGVIGNEDCGQMSAWYIFSALGFYPVFPASGDYIFGSPLFDKASINLPGQKKFIVEAVNNSPENIYIQKVERNGKPYSKLSISHADLMRGGTLKFYMGPNPNKAFGAKSGK
jgi:predicted alpha-1,2-mannosidase